MNASQPARFDLLETPLLRGTSLLEASAGTGKTYAIAGLFVRLILEADLSVDEILAVTYTEAATAELRQRIRQTLVNALKTFSGQPTDDGFLRALVEKHAAAKAEMTSRLERALGCFDQAAIYTIHGFCQRTLQDRAFESGALFDVELVTEQSAIMREIAEDYWRKHFYAPRWSAGLPARRDSVGVQSRTRDCSGDTLKRELQHAASETGVPSNIAVRFVLKNGFTPEKLLGLFKQCVNHPFLKFHSRGEGKSLDELAHALEQTFNDAREEWKRDKKTIRSLFGSHAGWGNKPYNRDDEMAEHFERLEVCFSATDSDFESLDALEVFRASAIAAGVAKKSKSPAPRHKFFDLCEQLAEAEADFLAALQLDFARFAQDELPRRKQRLKVRSFDDLLMNVYRALQSDAGNALAETLRGKHKAALIDEFQDTDPVQYEIFRRVFAGGKSFLYLIGDPKQAIYAFRGADIFTYMQAANKAERRFTLGENWRSEKKLVEAVNTIFHRPQKPFVFDEIRFDPVVAKARADKEPLLIGGEKESPFQIWFYEREGKSISKIEAEKRLPQIVAGEIARLLNSDARIGDRALKPEDIAVLVPENKHAQQMQDALRAVNVPSVLHTAASLFESFEAMEFRRVLLAIAQPTDERLLKAALATELIGFNGTRLVELTEVESQNILERFHDYLASWVERGFFRMFRQWLQRESVRQRLLAFPDGERRLTNVLHLGEALHKAEGEFRFGVGGLLKWLGEQMNPDALTAEEHQLRLERDDNAVRLITIHKSKGLQYGIVFCPFNWRDSKATRRGAKEIFFHDPADAMRPACDLGGDGARTALSASSLGDSRKLADKAVRAPSASYDEHLQLAERERLAENVRLMYVAVTRAVHRCCFVWGGFNDAGSSAPAWLFHQPAEIGEPKLEELDAHFKELSDDEMQAQLTELADVSAGAIEIQDLPATSSERFQPPESQAQKLSCREFTGKIPRDWRISSFSFLTAGQIEEAPDYDNVRAAENEAEPASGIFAFPRGVRAGTCLHEILQQVDFTQFAGAPASGTARKANKLQHAVPEAGAPIVEERLRAYNLLSTDNANAVGEMLTKLANASLESKKPDFKLSRVAVTERLNELEFYFPVSKIALPKLQDCLARFSGHGLQPVQSERFTFDPVSGFMKGFVDLVFRLDGRFYITDWKSNWLGNR
ncbi:MAG TPA: UvrD-helicase domain-containing protein, partial [Verrucomicrobiae bacterium]